MRATKKPAASDLDALTRRLTAFNSFHDLLHAKGGYRPSLRCISGCPSPQSKPMSQRSKPKILVTIEGGLIQSIVATHEMDVHVVDFGNFASGDYETFQAAEAEGAFDPREDVELVSEQAFETHLGVAKENAREMIED